jgi:predicted alpha/beta hydrolase family esterase
MRTYKDFSVLIHPGLNGSGPDHWHSHWEQAFPDFVRVQQADWGHPVYDAWASINKRGQARCICPFPEISTLAPLVL